MNGNLLTTERNRLYVYIAVLMTLVVPAPGRFVYGLLLAAELNLLVLAGTLMNALVNRLGFQRLRSSVLFILTTSLAIIFRQILAVTCTEAALVLGFVIYLPAFSVLLIDFLMTDVDAPLPASLRGNCIPVLRISMAVLVIFLFRDLAGFGTFTFFGKDHCIQEFVLVRTETAGISALWATVPGAFILSAVLLLVYTAASGKFSIAGRAGLK